MPLHPSIADHLSELRALASRYGLRSIAVIGSGATGRFQPGRSDLDLLVDFGDYRDDLGRRVLGFYRDVQNLFGHRVDVVSVHGIKNPTWREVLRDEQVAVYGSA